MCFSAAASFGVGALLLPPGLYCIQSAIRKSPAYLPLAAVPLVFGIQQICEGLVWLGLDHADDDLVRAASLVYLQFALFFWPFWIPFSILFLQTSRKKRLMIGAFALLGFVGGLGLTLPLLIAPELVETSVYSHSIHYNFSQSPTLELITWPIWKVLYLAIVAVPILMADSKEVVVVGLVLILLAAGSHFFNAFAYISVWCFFAAILSAYLCYLFFRLAPAQMATLPKQAI